MLVTPNWRSPFKIHEFFDAMPANMTDTAVNRSFVIPVLDFSPHSPYSIYTLLEDLADVSGEVICIFNSEEVFEALKSHSRIDKFAYNNLNVRKFAIVF